jgi:hypothetical protein
MRTLQYYILKFNKKNWMCHWSYIIFGPWNKDGVFYNIYIYCMSKLFFGRQWGYLSNSEFVGLQYAFCQQTTPFVIGRGPPDANGRVPTKRGLNDYIQGIRQTASFPTPRLCSLLGSASAFRTALPVPSTNFESHNPHGQSCTMSLGVP